MEGWARAVNLIRKDTLAPPNITSSLWSVKRNPIEWRKFYFGNFNIELQHSRGKKLALMLFQHLFHVFSRFKLDKKGKSDRNHTSVSWFDVVGRVSIERRHLFTSQVELFLNTTTHWSIMLVMFKKKNKLFLWSHTEIYRGCFPTDKIQITLTLGCFAYIFFLIKLLHWLRKFAFLLCRSSFKYSFAE